MSADHLLMIWFRVWNPGDALSVLSYIIMSNNYVSNSLINVCILDKVKVLKVVTSLNN